MFGTKIKAFTLLGFAVYIDLSWLIIVVLLTWSLATVWFPGWYENLGVLIYWSMGAAGALGLFASVVLHELAHSLVARGYGVQIRGITLFIFGGLAEMESEPPTPKAEFFIAIAGPGASVLIAATCICVAQVGETMNWPIPLNGVLWYLGWVNSILVIFNLLPAFPLDGGRVLRSVLWQIRGSVKWATQVTATLGGTFGLFLMVLGILTFIQQQFVAGMWQFLIGMFLRSAAQSSYQQLLVRQALHGETVSELMQTEVKTVPPDITVQQLVDDHIYKHHHKMFPVVEDGELLGCVTTRQVKEVSRPLWAQHTVGEIAAPCSSENTIDAGADAMKALARMSQNRESRLMVVQEQRLLGVIALKDMLNFIALRIELEEDNSPGGGG